MPHSWCFWTLRLLGLRRPQTTTAAVHLSTNFSMRESEFIPLMYLLGFHIVPARRFSVYAQSGSNEVRQRNPPPCLVRSPAHRIALAMNITEPIGSHARW